MKLLGSVLAIQVVLGLTLVVLVATDNLPFVDDDGDSRAATPHVHVDRFDSRAAWRLLREQVELGPRPAGSATSRRLAERLRRLLPGGHFQAVPGGLRNVVGSVPGRTHATIVVGAHYDTKDLPGFVGANDGAGGTAAVVQLARSLEPHTLRHRLVFVLFDGEESPAGAADFERFGLRGSKVAARSLANARALILLDFVADKRLRIPREANSDARLWQRLRAAAQRVGAESAFPDAEQGAISDDHIPFLRRGVRSIDLIDFDFDCWHRACDDLSAVSERSLDASGETVYELLRSF